MIDTMHLHPMIVHFPIALLIVGFAFDIAGLFIKRESFTNTGFYLLLIGAAGTVAAFISGDIAGGGITEAGSLGQALERHEEAAELTIWLVIIAAAFRLLLVVIKKYTGYLKAAALVLMLASVISVGRTGHYGGKLVYENAAGVQFNLGNDIFAPADENVDEDEDDD